MAIYNNYSTSNWQISKTNASDCKKPFLSQMCTHLSFIAHIRFRKNHNLENVTNMAQSHKEDLVPQELLSHRMACFGLRPMSAPVQSMVSFHIHNINKYYEGRLKSFRIFKKRFI